MGGAGEAAVAAQFAALGFNIFTPVFCVPDVDLIVEKDGVYRRVQVKTNTNNDPALRFAAWHQSQKSDYVGSADWLALHSTAHNVTAFLRPEEAGIYPTLRYDNPGDCKKGNPKKFARDYPITRVLEEA